MITVHKNIKKKSLDKQISLAKMRRSQRTTITHQAPHCGATGNIIPFTTEDRQYMQITNLYN